MVLRGKHTTNIWLLQVVMSVEFLAALLAESGHNDLFYHPTPYLKR